MSGVIYTQSGDKCPDVDFSQVNKKIEQEHRTTRNLINTRSDSLESGQKYILKKLEQAELERLNSFHKLKNQGNSLYITPVSNFNQ